LKGADNPHIDGKESVARTVRYKARAIALRARRQQQLAKQMGVIQIGNILHGVVVALASALVLTQVQADDGAAMTIDIGPYQQSIAAIERQHGGVDYRLSEHFLSLGLAYRANGDTDNAVDAFEQALHVNRINKGLHHLIHIPIVDLLIESYSRRGDWQEVERQHRYRYWIYRREVEAKSAEFADGALTFATWETRAYNLDTGVPPLRRLRDAQDALDAAYETLNSDDRSDDPQMINILNAQAQANLNLALHMNNTAEDRITGGAVMGDDFGDIIERRNIIIESFINGKEALEHVVSATDTDALRVQHGLALANLADWEMIFDRPQSSAENYRRAYEQLKAAGLSDDQLAIEFDNPRQMSQFTVELRNAGELPASPTDDAFVTATFIVTKSGRARTIEVVDANPPDNSRIIRRTRDTVRATRFRPRISDSGPVEAPTTIRYIFPDVSI
jgi:tetratricopeptide (TPR) repeat protein